MDQFYAPGAALLLVFTLGWFVRIIFELLKERIWWKKLYYRLSTSEQYFRVTVIYIVIVVAVGTWILVTASDYQTVVGNIGLLVQIATLVFAVYAGYFAFLQVNLGRFRETADSAKDYFEAGDYAKAIRKYRQAKNIEFDFQTESEHAECCACASDWDSYSYILELLPNAKIDDRDSLLLSYVTSLKPFLQEDIKAAKKVVKEAIQSKKNMKPHMKILWDFSEVEASENFKEMEEPHRKMLKDFFLYLSNELAADALVAFEGTYTQKK